jgi:hypothetical protein
MDFGPVAFGSASFGLWAITGVILHTHGQPKTGCKNFHRELIQNQYFAAFSSIMEQFQVPSWLKARDLGDEHVRVRLRKCDWTHPS